ncbi:hypothetical protein N0V93_007181 [Gnomoniopsis smithogilvyi]|uniref:Uncharacterized protein n=1 Tax=Gnomoniopsis smithogilvyi TaxID=1191159 RepID=A0A9W8YRA4_9PEZI|nr:hypothetical protein N0V93_007181 [Gnomoniopsis smithogilvyi]
MAKLVYHVENAPGKVYGKNSNELVFKEPNTHANIYTTATDTGLLRSTKKHLFRGPPSEKEGGVCVATIDEPSNGTLEMHHHPSGQDASSTSTKLKLKKTSSWVPLSGNDLHAVTFRDSTYTWSGKSTLKRDRDGRVVAKLSGSWFWQGKLADMELDIPEMGDEEERLETLEMVLASFVLRWWTGKVEEEEKAKEKAAAQKEQKEVKQAVAKEKKDAKREEIKKQKEEQEVKKLGETAQGAAVQDVLESGDHSHI